MSDRFDKFTERARKVLQLAQEEAQRFNHNYIGTEHLLLGLVREGDGVAARVLNNLGIELHKVRSAVEFIIGRGDRMVMGEIGLTPRAKRVIELAVDEARRLNHHYIGTEHLLLGLLREGEGIAAGVLESLGVSLEKVRVETMQVLGRTPGSPDVQGDVAKRPGGMKDVEVVANSEPKRRGFVRRRPEHRCSFCGKSHKEVARLVAGPNVYICNECVELCREIIEEEDLGATSSRSGTNEEINGEMEVAELDESLAGAPGLARAQIITLFDYSIWARDKLLEVIKGLDESKLKEGGQKGVYGPIFDTLVHMAGSEWVWIERCKGESPLTSREANEFPDLQAVVDWWNDVHTDAWQLLDTMSDDFLENEITYSAADGKTRTRKVWHMLLQVPNHQTEHRSQIATMLAGLDVEVPPTDLVVYLSESAAKQQEQDIPDIEDLPEE